MDAAVPGEVWSVGMTELGDIQNRLRKMEGDMASVKILLEQLVEQHAS